MTASAKIAFQGEPGAFSHQACRTYFPHLEPVAFPTFESAFEAIRIGQCGFGMIPVENTLAGRVSDVHRLLPNSGLKIIGEKFLPIHMQLMATKGTKVSDLTEVASHHMALAQCRKVIHELNLSAEVVYDTAGAAKDLAEHPRGHRAVIASAVAAELYDLEILRPNIEDGAGNTTRFLVMTGAESPAQPDFTAKCITSIMFQVRNVPAALYKALGGFATNGVNMIKLESYMEGNAFTATEFYVEVEGRPEDRGLALALDELNFFSSRLEIVGVYPADAYRRR